PAPVPEVNPDEDFANDPAAIIRPEAESSQESADTQPDYSRLSAGEERAARLDDMFARLVEAETEEAGRLIAEEIWAIWLDSGSASVNLIIRRGTGAQSSGNIEMARIMFDHVTRLAPGFAEGWARSSRLSLEEGDFSRAVGEAVQALSLEPRHFYALWTLGNVLEQMGRTEEALDAYREANRLYPALETVSDRISALELRMGGAVL
ncbi:MAG: tetratricopeptide repeat protein, partial [Pseudomonadota bacterium]